MNLQDIKEVLFRHGEKIVVGAVALFVILKVVGHFSGAGPEEAAEGVRVSVQPSEEVSKAIEPAFLRASRPYVSDLDITTPQRTPFWPPMTLPLADVRLQMEKKEQARREADAPIVGQPRRRELTSSEIADYAPDPERGFTKDPCRVEVSVDGNALVFKALQPGRWVAYEAPLANENRCRVLVKVDPKDLVIVDEIVPPEFKSLKEEELGTVVLRFTQPPKPEKEPDPRARRVVTLHLPTEYRIYRKSEYDEKRILIERIGARTKGQPPRRRPERRRPAGEGYPGGYPGAERPERPGRPRRAGGLSPEAAAEGGAAPVPARRPRRGARAPSREEPPPPEKAPRPAPREEAEEEEEGKFKPESDNEYVFVDRSVEAEVKYKYTVEAVVDLDTLPETGPEVAEEIEPKEIGPREIRTKQKFTFKYVGGTYDEARIMVFIGPTEEPLDQKTFTVPIGGYIGTLPSEPTAAAEPAEGEAPPPETSEGAVAQTGGEDIQFVTRYVLVDVIPNAFRVVPHVSTVSKRNEEGRLVPQRVTLLREELARQVIIRDRKQRLLRLWYERAPRRAKKKPESRRPRRPTRRR